MKRRIKTDTQITKGKMVHDQEQRHGGVGWAYSPKVNFLSVQIQGENVNKGGVGDL